MGEGGIHIVQIISNWFISISVNPSAIYIELIYIEWSKALKVRMG